MKKRKMKRLRSDCPVNFAVEMLCDRWSLIILRDMIFWGKKTYREFLRSDEKIATNILALRLEHLEKQGFVTRSAHSTDKRKEVYSLTERGIDLIPVIIELIAWSARDDTWQSMDHCPTIEEHRFVKRVAKTKNKAKIIEDVKAMVRRGSYVFEGIMKKDSKSA
jgi:DNA-binding HxlR family transcriptional regulator